MCVCVRVYARVLTFRTSYNNRIYCCLKHVCVCVSVCSGIDLRTSYNNRIYCCLKHVCVCECNIFLCRPVALYLPVGNGTGARYGIYIETAHLKKIVSFNFLIPVILIDINQH